MMEAGFLLISWDGKLDLRLNFSRGVYAFREERQYRKRQSG